MIRLKQTFKLLTLNELNEFNQQDLCKTPFFDFSSLELKTVSTPHHSFFVQQLTENLAVQTDGLRSITKNHNIVWDNKVHSLIVETHFPIISGNGG